MNNKDLEYAQAVFSEQALENAVLLGSQQYLIFGSSENMFAYRKPKWAENVRVFEVDSISNIVEKLRRLEIQRVEVPCDVYFIEGAPSNLKWRDALRTCEAYDSDCASVVNLMGISEQLGMQQWKTLLSGLNNMLGEGSAVVFDYWDTDELVRKQIYSEFEMEQIMSECGFRIYEHVNAIEMRQQYLYLHNLFADEKVIPPYGVNYCLAVRKFK